MLKIGALQIRLLERLCNAVSISGDEAEVRRIVLEAAQPYASEVKVDPLGSVLVTKRGKGRNRPRVMLDAHMDEVGFMIVAEQGDGLYEFRIVRGIDERHLPGKQVWVGREHTPGIIGSTPIHLLGTDDYARKPNIESLRIDLGPGGKAATGDRATFATRFQRSGPSILAKAIDDRIGVAILVELLRSAPDNVDLCLSFSVQEEIGVRGAAVAAHYFNPDLAFAIDATPANDLPTYDGSENSAYNTKLGHGPAIYVADKRTLHNQRLVGFLQQVAQDTGIPYQLRQPGGGGSNSGAIQLARSGIPAVSVSVPHRYNHSPVSVARMEDWKNTLNLLHAALQRASRKLIAGTA
jgi:endoglucanase